MSKKKHKIIPSLIFEYKHLRKNFGVFTSIGLVVSDFIWLVFQFRCNQCKKRNDNYLGSFLCSDCQYKGGN